jgi:hypothetical protein
MQVKNCCLIGTLTRKNVLNEYLEGCLQYERIYKLFDRQFKAESIYYIEGNLNVVGTDVSIKIFSGKLLDVALKSRLADRVVTDYSTVGGVVVIL